MILIPFKQSVLSLSFDLEYWMQSFKNTATTNKVTNNIFSSQYQFVI